MSSEKLQIPIFTGRADDWPEWKMRIKNYIHRKKCGPILEGLELRPTAKNAQGAIAIPDKDPNQDYMAYRTFRLNLERPAINWADILAFDSKNLEIYSHIAEHLSYSLQDMIDIHTAGTRDGVLAWKHLLDKYEGKKGFRLYHLNMKLSNEVDKRSDESIRDYITRKLKLYEEIKTVNSAALIEENQVIYLLMGIQKEFPEFVNSMTSRDSFTLSELISALERLDSLKASQSTIVPTDFAYPAYQKTDIHRTPKKFIPKEDPPKPKPKDKSKRCNWCLIPGHIESECRGKLAGKPRRIPPKAKETANVIQESALTTRINLDSNSWIVDSGASSHMTSREDLFHNLTTSRSGEAVSFADGQKGKIQGSGSITLPNIDQKGKDSLHLRDTLLIPSIKLNLISVDKLIEDDCTVVFSKKGSKIIKDDQVINIERRDHLFVIGKPREERALAVTAELWHARLGHSNYRNLKNLQDKVIGLEIGDDIPKNSDQCSVCIKAKQHKNPFRGRERRATNVLDLVHSDIEGPFPVDDILHGHKYTISFVDDFSKFIVVYTMKKKSEAPEKVKKFCAQYGQPRVLRSDNGGEYTSKEMEKLCLDRGIGREFTIPHTPEQNPVAERTWETLMEMTRALLFEKNLDKGLWARAIITAAYIRNRCLTSGTIYNFTPYELFYGERPDLSNLRVFGSRCIAHNLDPKKKKLDPRGREGIFVGYSDMAHGYVIYLPQEKKIILSRTVKFFEQNEDSIKSSPTDIRYVEHDSSSESEDDQPYLTPNQIRLEIPNNNNEIVQNPDQNARDQDAYQEERLDRTPEQTPEITGNESITPNSLSRNTNTPIPITSSPSPTDDRHMRGESATEILPPSSSTSETPASNQEVTPPVEMTKAQKKAQREGKSLETWSKSTTSEKRTRKPTQRFAENRDVEESSEGERALFCGEEINYGLFSAEPKISNDPKTFREAVRGPDSQKWTESMEAEIQSLTANQTWTLVHPPKDRNIVGSKWVYKIKKNSDGSVIKYKSRLVAQGFTQEPSIDFKETYAPVSRATTVRTLFAIAASIGFEVTQVDISTAYVNAEVEEEIFMKQPQGFEIKDKDGRELVCKLKKSLYGLKQSGRNWNRLITKWLEDYGFKRSQHDPCLFVLNQEGKQILLTIHVDDLLIAAQDKLQRNEFIKKLGEKFKLVDLGQVSWYLAIHIEQNEQGITLDQIKYIEDTIHRFGMDECRSTPVPAYSNDEIKRRRMKKEEFSNEDNENFEAENKVDRMEYLQIVGSLTYLATFTRPDIAFAVARASQKCIDPNQDDFEDLMKILRYLKGTKDLKLKYSRNASTTLVGYSDSDWAGNLDDRHSTSGYLFTLGGAAISWASRKQQTVALSVTEAEYISASLACQEAIYLRNLLKDMGYEQKTTYLFQDNQGSIAMARNWMTTSRSKHIEIRYHFIRECIERKELTVEYLRTNDQLADIFTKAVKKATLDQHN